MIEVEGEGIKIAENKEEKLVQRTIEGIENRIREDSLNLEIQKVVLEYLKKRKL